MEKQKSEKDIKEKSKTPSPQRALVLQGGAGLGAYEAGVYKVLYDWISKQIAEDKNVFDIIAGTSIGSINAAILVSYVIENKTWKGSAEQLEEFWRRTSTISAVELTPGFMLPWDYWHYASKPIKVFWDKTLLQLTKSFSYIKDLNIYFKIFNNWLENLNELFGIPASGEAARRYYSVKQLQQFGAWNVFLPLFPFPLDNKFFNYSPSNTHLFWPRYTNVPLREIISSFSYWMNNQNGHIKTKFDKDSHQPRLLVVSIDVAAGATVTFDSYENTDRKCRICEDPNEHKELVDHLMEIHGIQIKENDDLRWSVYGDGENQYTIFYDGISLEHVMASSSVPIYYDYKKINAKKITRNSDDGKFKTKAEEVERSFWDGQYISNTPLRELIHEHQRYWRGRIDSNNNPKNSIVDGKKNNVDRVPNLEVYIANVWPTVEKDVPHDHDGQSDRKNDIMFHDKTQYEEKVAELVNDYVNIAKDLIEFAKQKGATNDEVYEFLKKKYGTSISRKGKPRSYIDLLGGGFLIEKVIRIERADEPHGISEKWADYSSLSVHQLFEQGMKDTLRALVDDLIAILENPKKVGDIVDQSKTINNTILVPLTKAKVIILSKTKYTYYKDGWYDEVWNQLIQFTKMINAMEEKSDLTKEQADLIRKHSPTRQKEEK
jgi:NTE family protein